MPASTAAPWLDAGERVVDGWIAATTTAAGRAAVTGGTLYLTTQRLVFVPLSMQPGVAARPTMALPLDEIETVVAGAERPALIRVRRTDGGVLSYLVSRARWTPVWSRKNAPFRDDVVARLAAALVPGGTG